jgi:hypothetical protein
MDDARLEEFSPSDQSSLLLFGFRGSTVVAVDAVGGQPYREVTDEAGAQFSAGQ